MKSTQGHRCQLERKDDETGCSGGYLGFSAAKEAAERRGPNRAGCFNILQTSNDLESEVDEDHHGDHDEEVLEERDEADGGWGEEDGEGDEEMTHRGQLEQQDVKPVGMVRPRSVVETVEQEDSQEEREGGVDHHHGRSEYLSQSGWTNVVLRTLTAPLQQD